MRLLNVGSYWNRNSKAALIAGQELCSVVPRAQQMLVPARSYSGRGFDSGNSYSGYSVPHENTFC